MTIQLDYTSWDLFCQRLPGRNCLVCDCVLWGPLRLCHAERRRTCGTCAGLPPFLSSGAWTTNDTFIAKLCRYETPFIVTIRLKLSGQELQYDGEANVSLGPTKEPQLTGRAE